MSNPMQDNAAEPPAVSFCGNGNHISETRFHWRTQTREHVCFGSKADILRCSKKPLFDHPVGASEKRLRNTKPERRGAYRATARIGLCTLWPEPPTDILTWPVL